MGKAGRTQKPETDFVKGWLIALLFGVTSCAFGQGVTRYTYHDKEKKNIKEIFQVRDTVSNILQGRYISYFLNGAIESKGQFVNNETTGVWEFYYETGNLRMRGILRQNSNYGLWEFFYENGQKSMEGNINDRNREGEWKIFYESGKLKETGAYTKNKRTGLWKTFYEDGDLRGQIEYVDDHGRYTEFDHAGKVIAEGPKSGVRQVGHWRFYDGNGALQREGDYENNKKNGLWKTYHPSGRVASEGRYTNDEPDGLWTYYHEDGNVSASGEYASGQRAGYWSMKNPNGTLKGEITYNQGMGEYREYYASGKLRLKGMISRDHNEGKWQYYYEDGKLEGECDFVNGKGTYSGYYPSGTLQTKGQMEDNVRVGTWELYEQDGRLSGYYKPVEDQELADAISTLARKKTVPPAARSASKRTGFTYFRPRYPEYRGVILETNPFMMFLGQMPFGVEFYNEERLGHEFEFIGLRDPFFTPDLQIPQDEVYNRGYSISIKQKFYNPLRTGMWYFAHGVVFTNQSYFSNIQFLPQSPLITVSASEQTFEYALYLGARLMQRNDGDGFTMDAFVGYSAGYRIFEADPLTESAFDSINQDSFAYGLRFGLNLGYSFSFDGRRR